MILNNYILKTPKFLKTILLLLGLFLLPSTYVIANNITVTSSKNWSAINTGSGVGGLPAAADNISIDGGGNTTLTVDVAAAVCNNLTIGTTIKNNILTISGANSLAVGGNITFNTGDNNKTYQINVNAGTMTVAGTVTGGTNNNSDFFVTTGSLHFNNAGLTWSTFVNITLTSTGQVYFNGPLSYNDSNGSKISLQSTGHFTFHGLLTQSNGTLENKTTAGTMNFDAGYNYSNSSATFTSMAAELINFSGPLTNSSASAFSFNATSTEDFIANNPIVTPTSSITFGNVQIDATTLNLAGDILVAGNWTNNGGTLSGGAHKVTFQTGTLKTIGGTCGTTFPNLNFGTSAIDCTYSLTGGYTYSCNNLTIDDGGGGAGSPVTLTHATTEVLSVGGTVTMIQPTTAGQSNAWKINGGSATFTGAITFTGISTAAKVTGIYVTTGSITIPSLAFASETTDANQVISVNGSGSITITPAFSQADGTFIANGGGTINFTNQLTVTGGTINIGATGIMCFNHAGAYALDYGTGSVPILTTVAGSKFKFYGDFRATTAFTPNAGSNSWFEANSTITPTAAITFGNVQLDAGAMTLAGNITIAGNWYHNGGTTANSGGPWTITFSGSGKTIDGTVTTSFLPNVTIGTAATSGASYTLNGAFTYTIPTLTLNICTSANSFTHQLSTTILNVTNAVINQSSAAVTTAWNINAGSATVSGTLSFPGTTTTANTIALTTVTTGLLTVTTALSFGSNTTDANNVISVTNGGVITITPFFSQADGTFLASGGGTINFTNQLTVTGGTLNVDGTSTLAFKNTGFYALDYGTGSIPTLTTVAGSTLQFNGWLRATTAFTLNSASNSIFTGIGTIISTAAITFGNLEISNGIQVTLAGDIAVNGNWLAHATSDLTGNFTVTFSGTAVQTITNASGETFYNLTVANTFPTQPQITLSNPVNVSNTLTMSSGVIKTTAPTNIVTIANFGTTTIGSASSYIDGPMAYQVGFVGTTTINFPIGQSTTWRPATLAVTHGNGAMATYTAQMYNSSATALGYTMTGTIDRVSNIRYWHISTSSPFVLTGATVQLYYNTTNTDDKVTDYTHLHVAKNNIVNATTWSDIGGVATGNLIGSITSGIFTSFSDFSFANERYDGTNPLPIELLSFNAKPKGSVVDLNWATASEINNDFFTIEKTIDGVHFEIVGTVKGAGNNTSILNYVSNDDHPYSGVSYYRLKQTDYNGKSSYSDLKTVSFEITTDFSFNIYPNPTGDGVFNLQLNAKSNKEVLVVVYDVLGKQMYSKVLITGENESNVYAIDPTQKLPSGVYVITATSSEKIFNKKLIVN